MLGVTGIAVCAIGIVAARTVTDQKRVVSRIDHLLSASSLGVVTLDRSDADLGPEALDAAHGFLRFSDDEKDALGVIVLRPYAEPEIGSVSIARLKAPVGRRSCINHAENLMSLAMKEGDVRRIGFACASSMSTQASKGECEVRRQDTAPVGIGADFTTPIQFKDEFQHWTLVCRLTA